MVAAASLPKTGLPEQRILIHGVPWNVYVTLSDTLDVPGLRLTYLNGALEIMAPSRAHETKKKSVARLVETYAFLLRLPLNGYGSTTFRKEAKERGAEPDECWTVGRQLHDEEFPDIVLEVIETAPLLNKLSVYDGFGVPEVWIYERGAFSIHRRRSTSGYARATKSALLPALDFALIAKLAAKDDQQSALESLQRALSSSSGTGKARSTRRSRPRSASSSPKRSKAR
jgi:Uma2 family endonuclease